jgi:predicted HAD superfamily Cof-like phosphohydrolase
LWTVIQSPLHLVREFHDVFGLASAERPENPPDELVALRQRLLEEEVDELVEAVRGGRLPEVARELADVVYVAYGTAVTYGIDLDAVLAEVHQANMSKLGPDGRPVLCDGKVQKGDGFAPPDVAGVLSRQSEQ